MSILNAISPIKIQIRYRCGTRDLEVSRFFGLKPIFTKPNTFHNIPFVAFFHNFHRRRLYGVLKKLYINTWNNSKLKGKPYIDDITNIKKYFNVLDLVFAVLFTECSSQSMYKGKTKQNTPKPKDYDFQLHHSVRKRLT